MSFPTFAPGCYGSALTYSSEEALCSTCPFASGCAVEHRSALMALQAKLGVPEAYRLKDETPALSPAVTKMVEILRKTGIAISESLRGGINPFREGAMQVICHLLLNLNSPVTPALAHRALAMRSIDAFSVDKIDTILRAMSELGAVDYIDGAAKVSKV